MSKKIAILSILIIFLTANTVFAEQASEKDAHVKWYDVNAVVVLLSVALGFFLSFFVEIIRQRHEYTKLKNALKFEIERNCNNLIEFRSEIRYGEQESMVFSSQLERRLDLWSFSIWGKNHQNFVMALSKNNFSNAYLFYENLRKIYEQNKKIIETEIKEYEEDLMLRDRTTKLIEETLELGKELK
jgi:hypothetical protein